MQAFVFISAILLWSQVSSNDLQDLASVGNTLELVHVVFRHGDRTPDSLYPNDPHTAQSFYPEGLGHLTNRGKKKMYGVGESLREKYGRFLGDVYVPEVLHCISSHYPRAKSSLQLVLAGLYPPASIQTWNDDLNWQPIPCDYLKEEENQIFVPVTACPNYVALQAYGLLQSYKDPTYIKYKHLLPYLKEVSGSEYEDLFTVGMYLYDTLSREEEYGLSLPSWSKNVYPHILKDIARNSFKYSFGLGKLKILSPGFLMSQIVNNTYSTINGDASANGRKIYLYSGHDLNVAAILFFFDRMEPRIIQFGAQIIIEVHKILGQRFFRVFLENYTYSAPEPIYIPKCGYFCPVNVFADLYADVLDPQVLQELCYNQNLI